VRVTLGKKTQESGMAEVKIRRGGEMQEIALAEVADYVCNLVQQMIAENK
jgi:hypothetical protein